MNELEGLTEKLLAQQRMLLAVILEAEAKRDEYLKAIAEGRAELKKVENILKAMGKN